MRVALREMMLCASHIAEIRSVSRRVIVLLSDHGVLEVIGRARRVRSGDAGLGTRVRLAVCRFNFARLTFLPRTRALVKCSLDTPCARLCTTDRRDVTVIRSVGGKPRLLTFIVVTALSSRCHDHTFTFCSLMM